MTTYTHKFVNGKSVTLTSADNTVLAARDAAHWASGAGVALSMSTRSTTADKVARLAKTFGLTLEQLKAELR